ncbi:unnamed protein product [Rotaria magnacalcarata]|uniref:Uncharacterized protein n=1 Tax=Rotaria magnacalcarata TaxID=392030 RepID=A0A816TDI6_9BILA|nr:unnamed protein product [Rotaria magnacalcarata]CAF4140177.1 unnamed protein product [Rotaria magnacalcarata]
MSIRDDNDFHLEVSEEGEVVEMNASSHANDVISTKGVGPCVAFIWSFNFDESPDSILDHYSFPDDESKSTVECTMILLLSRFLSLLEEFLCSIHSLPKIINIELLISKSIEARTPHSATSSAVDLVAFHPIGFGSGFIHLGRKYDVTEETNNEDVACSSPDDSSKQQKLKYYNELKKVDGDDKIDDADYDSEDDVSDDENNDYDENYYDNNYDNDEPLHD